MKLRDKDYNKIAIILIAVFIVESLFAIMYNSPVYDETAHIGGAYHNWKTGNITLVREQPPLVKIVAGAPLVAMNLTYPKSCVVSNVTFDDDWTNPEQRSFGACFLYKMGNDLDNILLFSRLAIVSLSIILAVSLFLFTKRIYGPKAATFALFLYVFEANIIAHSSLVTMDLAVSLFMFLTITAMWNFLKSPTDRNAIVVGVFFALAQVSKFTGLYLVPIIFLFTLFFLYKKTIDVRDALKLIAVISIISLFAINLAYLFQGTGKALTDNISVDRIEPHVKNNPLKPVILLAAQTPVPLPENYLLGLSDVILHDLSGHPAFFLGEYSRTGWWYYFPVLFVLKVSVVLLAFAAVSAYTFKKRGFEKGDARIAEFMAIAFIVIFFSINLFSHINIGIRHVLPILPFVFFLCSKPIKYASERILKLYVALAVLFALSSLLTAPHYIQFFTEPVGSNGYKYALDSNYDWGQDLKGLRDYMQKNDINSVGLKYFGVTDEAVNYYGIDYSQLECNEKPSGMIAISAYYLMEAHPSAKDCYQWLQDYTPTARIGAIFVYNTGDR